ncbi:hypothetical protein Taro_028664 [Colocasia esculenta]|uniref:Uncharacterized protein n=1 Tax=Colocasia esculenta TaxID=4460 RepID=A0A843VSK7_COLES|nr:hypothetical protein [Colocasia esculenta]
MLGTIAGDAIVDDDAEFERLMNLGPLAHSQFMREARTIASAQPRRKGSHTQAAAPSQPTKGKGVATSQPTKGKGKDIGQAGGPAKGIVIREPTAPAQKKKKETPPEESPRLPSSRSHDSMTTGSPGGFVGGGDGDGGGGGGGGIEFTAEQHYGGHCTQDTDHGGPVQYNRRRKFREGGGAEGSAVDSDSYNTMISDFERMSTYESVGSYGYGGHSYQPEFDTGYSSGYSGYATTGYPAPYFDPPPFIHVHVPVPVQQRMCKWRVVNIESAKETSKPCESGQTGAEPTLPNRFQANRPDSPRFRANRIASGRIRFAPNRRTSKPCYKPSAPMISTMNNYSSIFRFASGKGTISLLEFILGGHQDFATSQAAVTEMVWKKKNITFLFCAMVCGVYLKKEEEKKRKRHAQVSGEESRSPVILADP